MKNATSYAYTENRETSHSYPDILRMKLETNAKQMPEHTDAPLTERHVNMHNAITRGAQGLNLSQKRIIALALAKTDSKPMQNLLEGQRNGWLIRLQASDYATTYDVDANTAYEQLKDGAKSLLKTLWTTIDTTGRKKTITQGQWLSLAKYHEGQGVVDIVFHPMIAPFLLGLRQQFVTYKLKQVAALRSIYSWRMYECIKSWESTGRWAVTVEDFAKIIEAPKTYHADFGQLKRWVIEPAIKELREKQHLVIECEEIKAGRKVLELIFKFAPDPQKHLDL